MPSSNLLRLAAATTVVAGIAAATLANPSEKTVGKPAKTFAVTAVTGMPVRKYPVQFFEGRVLLIHFFGTYSERESDALAPS